MFLSFFASGIFDFILLVIVIIIIITVASILIVRDLKMEFKKVFKIRSRFHIEIRKIVNLIYKIYNSDILEPFTKVVIKNLPHEEKKILLKNIDLVFSEINVEDLENKYIIETYENLQKLRRERDAKIIVYNHKLETFPFSVYTKIMKLNKYELYTEKE
ncbi:hypothetical protein RJI07_07665 [Mycoplasmatota bacterium WC30]